MGAEQLKSQDHQSRTSRMSSPKHEMHSGALGVLEGQGSLEGVTAAQTDANRHLHQRRVSVEQAVATQIGRLSNTIARWAVGRLSRETDRVQGHWLLEKGGAGKTRPTGDSANRWERTGEHVTLCELDAGIWSSS